MTSALSPSSVALRTDSTSAMLCLFVNGLELETHQVAILPQRGDGVGNRFAAADRGENASSPLNRYLVQHRCRQLVQQMRVVDADDAILIGDNGFARCGDERDRVAGR
jgi:hypothetical protein